MWTAAETPERSRRTLLNSAAIPRALLNYTLLWMKSVLDDLKSQKLTLTEAVNIAQLLTGHTACCCCCCCWLCTSVKNDRDDDDDDDDVVVFVCLSVCLEYYSKTAIYMSWTSRTDHKWLWDCVVNVRLCSVKIKIAGTKKLGEELITPTSECC